MGLPLMNMGSTPEEEFCENEKLHPQIISYLLTLP